MRDGVIDPKTKEMIALGIGVASRCDGCIGFHVRTLVKMGMTLQELEEAFRCCCIYGRWAFIDVCRKCTGCL